MKGRGQRQRAAAEGRRGCGDGQAGWETRGVGSGACAEARQKASRGQEAGGRRRAAQPCGRPASRWQAAGAPGRAEIRGAQGRWGCALAGHRRRVLSVLESLERGGSTGEQGCRGQSGAPTCLHHIALGPPGASTRRSARSGQRTRRSARSGLCPWQRAHQSSPSNSPSPLMALVLKMDQSRLLIEGRPSPSATCSQAKAPPPGRESDAGGGERESQGRPRHSTAGRPGAACSALPAPRREPPPPAHLRIAQRARQVLRRRGG